MAVHAVTETPIADTYDITVGPASIGGSVTYTRTNDYTYVLRARPVSGAEFVSWSDAVTTNPRTVDANEVTTLTATFQWTECTGLGTLTEEDVEDIYVVSSITTSVNRQSATVTSTDNHTFTIAVDDSRPDVNFDRWTDDGDAGATRTVTVTSDGAAYTASFLQDYCTGTESEVVEQQWYVHDDPVYGNLTATSTGNPNEYTLSATAADGNAFVRWTTGDVMHKDRVVTVNPALNHTSYTATFLAQDGQIQSWTAGANSVNVETVSRDLEGTDAKVYLNGTLLASPSTSSTSERGVFGLDLSGASPAVKSGDNLHVIYYCDASHPIDVMDMVVPVTVNTATNVSSLTLPANISETDIHVLDGGALTFDANTEFAGLDIYAGGKAVIPTGKTVNASSVTMRADGVAGKYPQLVVNGALNNANTDTVYYDYALNYSAYYPFALPYDGEHEAIRNRIGTTASFEIGSYDGSVRATGESGWGGVFDDANEDIPAGEGFTVFAVPRKWNGTRQTKAVVRFPMVADLKGGETVKNITVHTYGNASTKDNDRNWNFIGNPYLADLNVDAASDEGMNIMVGIFEKTLSDDIWYGDWNYTGDLRYVTIPSDGFTTYTQEPVKTANLLAFHSYFVQAKEEGVLTFSLSRRAQDAPAKRRLSAYADMSDNMPLPEMAAGITLTQETARDHTGLLLGAAFSDAYDYNADLSKVFGSRQGLSVYTLDSSLPLAYIALPAEETTFEKPYREVVVPLGYRNASLSEMSFAFDTLRYNLNNAADSRITALLLSDLSTGDVTDLLTDSYTCRATQAADDTRFLLTVRYVYTMPEDANPSGQTTGLDDLITAPLSASDNKADGVYDVLGRKVAELTVNTSTLPTGVYIFVKKGEARKEVVR